MDLSSPDSYARGFPHAVFRELRERDPVSLQKDGAGKPFWAVTRHADVITVLKTPAVFSTYRGSVLFDDPPPAFLTRLRESMLNRDPPEHTQLRRLVNHVFSPRRIEKLEHQLASHARSLVDRVHGKPRCDFATEIAGEMPLFVICEILGVPLEDRNRLYGLTSRMFSNTTPDALAQAIEAAGELRAYGAALAQRKAAAPADDLLSDLIVAEIEGRRLTPGEVEAFFMLLFNAGADTTRGLLCLGLDVLFDHPEALATLVADPARLPAAIEEMLRFTAPTIQFRRTATTDTRLGDAELREGDRVVVFFPSANRDAAVFAEPDRFDLGRSPNPHISFGYGTHHCIGAVLARLEAKHVFGELLQRYPGVARGGALVTARSNFIRSVHHQPIELGTG